MKSSECAELDDVDAADYCGGEHCYLDVCSACALESTECIACSGCVEHHSLMKMRNRRQKLLPSPMRMSNCARKLTSYGRGREMIEDLSLKL